MSTIEEAERLVESNKAYARALEIGSDELRAERDLLASQLAFVHSLACKAIDRIETVRSRHMMSFDVSPGQLPPDVAAAVIRDALHTLELLTSVGAVGSEGE